MKIGFRVDASRQIGGGHIMRCLVLANALRSIGASCFFFVRELEGNLGTKLKDEGHNVIWLPPPTGESTPTEQEGPPHQQWLEVSWTKDWTDFSASASSVNGRLDWLVVDHYALDARWHRRARDLTNHILVIDDVADRDIDCDLLLNQNLPDASFLDAYNRRLRGGPRLLLGPDYALLRPEFAASRQKTLPSRQPPDAEPTVFVSMGMMDAGGMNETIARALLPTGALIHIAIGSSARTLPSLQSLAEANGSRLCLHIDSNEVASLMSLCDLAVGAGGGTSWERCCLGLPALVFSLADNQHRPAIGLHASGCAIYLGEGAKFDSARFLSAYRSISRDRATWRRMSAAAAGLCDGQGSTRVVDAMALS
ncbi:UDP-2,4-diacetamido-2,4,6-trideoxy-beta-L-altropyranose hydrolase [Radicibacter daui]|uniref:UDP-2,4-diacetamido-2,4, 6-trideoxy-beta-L-altropyranose hydrolase n=1 Tax=Radicibacter daui TaxID=3064829 RepID=UPI0040469916